MSRGLRGGEGRSGTLLTWGEAYFMLSKTGATGESGRKSHMICRTSVPWLLGNHRPRVEAGALGRKEVSATIQERHNGGSNEEGEGGCCEKWPDSKTEPTGAGLSGGKCGDVGGG